MVELKRAVRQTLRRAKHAANRIRALPDAFALHRDPLIPPAHLRLYYYGTTSRETFTRHCEAMRAELTTRGLQPAHRVLDPSGRDSAATYHLPFENASFDVVLLASVFTHMMPDEIENYLSEIRRVLAPGGWCVASFFLLNDDTRRDVDAGLSFMSFAVPHPPQQARLHDAAVREAAVAVEESFVRRCCDAAGLVVRDVRRGPWASATTSGHDVVTLGRPVDLNGRA